MTERPTKRQWWQVAQAAVSKSGEPELWIYGDIVDDGWSWDDDDSAVEPRKVREALAELGEIDRLTVRINSMGGGVFAGLGIHSILVDHPAHVTVQVDGLAGSIASVIAMAGDEITMRPGAMMMIHNPYSLGLGDGDELRKQAAVLDTIRDSLVEVYADRTGLEADEIRELMAAETWMLAREAVARGFADRLAGEDLKPEFADRGRFLVLGGVRHPIHRLQEGAMPRAEEALARADVIEEPTAAEPEDEQKPVAEPAPEPAEEPESIAGTVAPVDIEARLAAARAEGAATERARIQALEELVSAAGPGHAELLARAKYTAPMAAGDLAVEIIRAGARQRAQHLADRAADAPTIGDPSDPDSLFAAALPQGDDSQRTRIVAAGVAAINARRGGTR